uniref:Uncharacterized protein n=1 Tax=Knipowitschia caucasica TaxID=637954 RepID=A0AAV2KR88_KNICA
MFLVKDGNGNFGSDRDALPAGGRTLRWKSSSRRKVVSVLASSGTASHPDERLNGVSGNGDNSAALLWLDVRGGSAPAMFSPSALFSSPLSHAQTPVDSVTTECDGAAEAISTM